MCELT